jgi:hypothetical protein
VNLKRKGGVAVRPSHLLRLVHLPIDQEVRCAFENSGSDTEAGPKGSERRMTMTDIDTLAAAIMHDGFAVLTGARMCGVLKTHGALSDWSTFTASWNDLGLDTYMADGGRYRKRRHATYASDGENAPIRRAPHQPHYQSRDYNPVNGGIQRWFEPVLPDIGDGASMRAILGACRALFERLVPVRAWHVEVHQFRVEARADVAGQPTPEGVHRDGVDFVLVLLIGRRNVRSGVTSLVAPDGTMLGSFTLVEPMDTVLLDDLRVLHGVTPVQPIDPTQPSTRDVLVVTFRHSGTGSP